MSDTNTIKLPKKVYELRTQAKFLRDRADKIEEELYLILENQAVTNLRKSNDKAINRKQALTMLWFNSYPALRKWEAKMKPYGYLQFNDDVILRSELLRFLDDYHSGKIKRLLYEPKNRGVP